MNNLKIIYLVGLPGSGKSTYLIDNGMTNNSSYVIISNDLELEVECQKQGKTYSELWGKFPFSEIKKRCRQKFEDAIKNKIPTIIIDNTNMTRKSRRIYLSSEYKREAIVFTTSRQEIEQRLKKRNLTGKVISNEVLDRMEKSFEPIDKINENFSKVSYI